MMKGKDIFRGIVMMAMLNCGCYAREVQYHPNLGFDFSRVKYQEVVFHVYHSDPADHTWELLAEFPCEKESGHYSDVVLAGEENQIGIVLRNNTSYRTDDGSAIVYDGKDVMTYTVAVPGFDGWLPGWQTFAIKEKTGEQPVRLYPISDKSAVYASLPEGEFNPDIVYEIGHEYGDGLLDNILITVIMK